MGGERNNNTERDIMITKRVAIGRKEGKHGVDKSEKRYSKEKKGKDWALLRGKLGTESLRAGKKGKVQKSQKKGKIHECKEGSSARYKGRSRDGGSKGRRRNFEEHSSKR